MPGFGARLRILARKYGAIFLSFGAMQAMQFLLPLLALPWLGRSLGPEAFGLLMYMCLIPPLVALFMDWGLSASGARKAARERGDERGLALLLGAALGSKLVLAAFCLVICLVVWPLYPHAREYPGAYWLAVLAGLGRGINPVWFFQGTAREMPVAAAWDTGAALLALILVFVFITNSERWPLYLLFIAAGRLIAYGSLTARLCKRYRPVPDLRAGLRLLRASAVLAGSALATLFCQNGPQMALGYILSAEAMGMLVAINKMLRSLVACLNPVSQTLYADLCVKQRQDALQTLKWSLLVVVGCAAISALLVWLTAPLLIALALGPGYEPAVAALRITILAAPFMALNNALANQALIPFDLEKSMFAAQAGCALTSLPVAIALAGIWGLNGGAALPLCVEALLTAALSRILLQSLRKDYKAPISR